MPQQPHQRGRASDVESSGARGRVKERQVQAKRAQSAHSSLRNRYRTYFSRVGGILAQLEMKKGDFAPLVHIYQKWSIKR